MVDFRGFATPGPDSIGLSFSWKIARDSTLLVHFLSLKNLKPKLGPQFFQSNPAPVPDIGCVGFKFSNASKEFKVPNFEESTLTLPYLGGREEEVGARHESHRRDAVVVREDGLVAVAKVLERAGWPFNRFWK